MGQIMMAMAACLLAGTARMQAEEGDRVRAARAAARQREKCERLRLKQKWAADDVARVEREAGGVARVERGATHSARLKAQRQAEALAVECPA